jgi:hypothetical protein
MLFELDGNLQRGGERGRRVCEGMKGTGGETCVESGRETVEEDDEEGGGSPS